MTSKSLLSKLIFAATSGHFFSVALPGFGQQLTGTLTGTTTDATGAVVANAKVTMQNESNGDIRTTVSNGSGYFSITAVQPGTYTVTCRGARIQAVEAERHRLHIRATTAHCRKLPCRSELSARRWRFRPGALTVPTDNAEISTTVPEHMINDFPMGNRDAGELLKIMPGMAFSNGASQGSGFSTKLVSSASGPVGQFSANGTQPSGAMSFMLDGTNLVDPGNAGSQMANINQDMVQRSQSPHVRLQRRIRQRPRDFPGLQQERRKQVPRRRLRVRPQQRTELH